MKKILIAFFVLLLILGLTISIFPGFFKEKVLALVEQELDRRFKAEIRFEDASLNMWSAFPQLNVCLKDVTVAGSEAFQGDTLLKVKMIDLRMALNTVISGDEIEVTSLRLRGPEIFARVNKKGKANWDILRDQPASESGSSLQLNLRDYALTDAIISYADEQTGFKTEWINLEHSGSVRINGAAYDIRTITNADRATVVSGGVNWLNNTATNIRADIRADLNEMRFELLDNEIVLNALKLALDGTVKQLDSKKGWNTDLTFNAPGTDIRQLLSLIPAAYTEDFRKVTTDGQMMLTGYLKGDYTSVENLPAFGSDVKVERGKIQYPGLPKPVEDITLAAEIRKPQGSMDKMVIRIGDGTFKLGQKAMQIALTLKDLLSDPFIDATLDGGLNLEDLASALPLDQVSELAGLIDLDIKAKGKLSDLEKSRYESFYMQGNLKLDNGVFASAEVPHRIMMDKVRLQFQPASVRVDELSGRAGESDIKARGSVQNLLSWLFKDELLKGNLFLEAGNLNLNEWIIVQESSASRNTKNEPAYAELPRNLDFTLDLGGVKQLLVEDLVLKSVAGKAHIKDGVLYADRMTGQGLGGNLEVSGNYRVPAGGQPLMDMVIKCRGIDIAKTLETFEVAGKIAPIAAFIKGKMDTEISVTGQLDPNYYPVLNSLDGKAFALLIQGEWIDEFPLLNALDQRLDIPAISAVKLKGLKTWFEFEDGRVKLEKPVEYTVENIDMAMTGSHGFDHTMDYEINFDLPRSRLGPAGDAIGLLQSKASALGIPVGGGASGDPRIRLALDITGSLSQPKVGIRILGLAEGQGSLVESVKNEVKDKALETVQKKTDQVLDEAVNTGKKAVEEELEKKTGEVLDKLGDKAGETVNDKAGEVLEEVGGKAGEEIKDKAGGVIDGIFGGKKKKDDG